MTQTPDLYTGPPTGGLVSPGTLVIGGVVYSQDDPFVAQVQQSIQSYYQNPISPLLQSIQRQGGF